MKEYFIASLSSITMISLCLLIFRFFNADFPTIAFKEENSNIFFPIRCSADYKTDQYKWKDCIPQICGRGFSDFLVKNTEVKTLKKLAIHGLSFGGSNGGVSILDLHSGALSKGDRFVNIYALLENNTQLFTRHELAVYESIFLRIRSHLAAQFALGGEGGATALHLTKPTFFSRMNNRSASTRHDEYWHRHVDRTTYGSFHYTALLYLTSFGEDFTGGRFVFVDKSAGGETTEQLSAVEPKSGRVSYFTSGSENVHFVEPVRSGVRFAITIPFTCDPRQRIDLPFISK